jgi:ABC-2 type transport system ATP-binding protein
MSQSILVNQLSLDFAVTKKEPGLSGALRNMIAPNKTKVTAVDNISFSIGPGELIGFIGPNGAGKTSTLKMLSGLLAPTSGDVSVVGYTPFERKTSFLKQISLVMGQKNQLLWDLPALDTFLLNKAIYSIPEQRYNHVLGELIDLLDVSKQLKTPVRKLSLGQRMKMELIAALLHTPKVLFLDEPTIGLDVVVQRNLRDFIREYNRQYEATILLTSHYMGDVQELCSRVIIISHGQILFDGKLQALIAKYAPNKIIRAVFRKDLKRDTIAKLGSIHQWNPPNVSILVPREQATKQAATLLQKFDISDLTIEETPIEDTIREIFHTSSI